MGTGGRRRVRRSVKKRGALTLGDADLWKLSVMIRVVFSRLRGLLAVRMWHCSVWKAVYGDVIDGKIRDG